MSGLSSKGQIAKDKESLVSGNNSIAASIGGSTSKFSRGMDIASGVIGGIQAKKSSQSHGK